MGSTVKYETLGVLFIGQSQVYLEQMHYSSSRLLIWFPEDKKSLTTGQIGTLTEMNHLILNIQYYRLEFSHDSTSNCICDFHLKWGLWQAQRTLQRFAAVHIFPAMSYVDNVFVLVWRCHVGFSLRGESRPRLGLL